MTMKNLPNLVFFGIQGSGKGTQGAIVAKKFGMKIFETGGALREIIASGTTLGKKVKEIIERGGKGIALLLQTGQQLPSEQSTQHSLRDQVTVS